MQWAFNRNHASHAPHLDSQAVEIVDVEDVLGSVAHQEGAADQEKHSSEAVKKIFPPQIMSLVEWFPSL